jgi:hypothetical protein
MKPTYRTPTQFDFARHWKRLVRPHLDDVVVQSELDKSMQRYCDMMNYEHHNGRAVLKWKHGDCPSHFCCTDYYCEHPIGGRKSLSYYRPYGLCHWMAPFVHALVRRIYPKDEWLVINGRLHSVVANRERTVVFDILLFDEYTARKSLLFSGDRPLNRMEEAILEKWRRKRDGWRRQRRRSAA